MIIPKTAITTSTIILVLFIGIFLLVYVTFGQSSSKSSLGDQMGRYGIAVNGEHAYLVDTVTGCVWRKSAQLPFILMSVEGLLEVPPHPKDDKAPPRKVPEKCQG